MSRKQQPETGDGVAETGKEEVVRARERRAAAATELLQKLRPRVISGVQACGFLALATLL